MGHNELLIREALTQHGRGSCVISVKFGAQRDPAGAWLGFDGRPASVKTFLAYTLRRLGTDYVDIYRAGRLDPAVPIEETVGAIGERTGATVAQLAIAWVLSRGMDVVPLVGARTRTRLAEALGATQIAITADDLAEIDRVLPPGVAAGERYPAPVLAHMDSERPKG
jgi:aryl-alcohol dehydrogenase-like predicted oxidoreductase